MKTPDDPRHKRRQHILEELFRRDFHKQKIESEASLIYEQKDLLDEKIRLAAPEFPVEKINKVDLAILRLAIYELTIGKKEPPNVIIDEAIELAKEYGGQSTPAFVNGALGKILKDANRSE